MKNSGYLTENEKESLKAELDKAAIGDRIISLKKFAEKIGIKRIKRAQVMGIIQTFTRRHPDYKAVQMLSHVDRRIGGLEIASVLLTHSLREKLEVIKEEYSSQDARRTAKAVDVIFEAEV